MTKEQASQQQLCVFECVQNIQFMVQNSSVFKCLICLRPTEYVQLTSRATPDIVALCLNVFFFFLFFLQKI